MLLKINSKRIPHETIAEEIFALASEFQYHADYLAKGEPVGIGADIMDRPLYYEFARARKKVITRDLDNLLIDARRRLINPEEYTGDILALNPVQNAMLSVVAEKLHDTAIVTKALVNNAPQPTDVDHPWGETYLLG